MIPLVVRGAVIAWTCMLCSACNGDPGRSADATLPGARAPAPETLGPAALPDLSSLAESVQRQVRERHTALIQTIAKPGASRSDQAAAYGALGRVLMAAKFSDEAASCYAHAEALVSDDMRWPYYLGHAYLRKPDRRAAAAAFERASKLSPRNAIVLVWLGETYFDDGQLEAAQRAFAQASSLDPQSAPALFGAGRIALARQNYQEAVRDLERALAADKRASAVHYPLAMAYRALGDLEKAEAHLGQRGSVYPELADPLMQPDTEVLDSAVAYETRGMRALRNADWTDAETAFRKGLELAPADASLRYWLAATLYAAGRVAEAEREFDAVLRQSPDFAKAHFSLGAIADGRGRRAEAIEHFRAAVQADQGLPEARLRLADDLRATGQLEASLAEYEVAVTLDPAIAEAWIGGAQALVGLRRNEKALDWLTRARRIHPNRTELAEMQARLTPRR